MKNRSVGFFNPFILNFLEGYSGELTAAAIVASLRDRLQFNDAPTLEQMRMGEVDCVGAAVILKEVLSKLLPSSKYHVVALPGVPWLERPWWDNKHCAVLEESAEGMVRIIDATPINGYGYGTISFFTPFSRWRRSGFLYLLKDPPANVDVVAWEAYIYPAFAFLTESDIFSMLCIDICRTRMPAGEGYQLPRHVPLRSRGWSKDLWRLRAKLAEKRGDLLKARQAYTKALASAPMNAYLHREYGVFLRKIGSKRAQSIESRADALARDLIRRQERIIREWSEAVARGWRCGAWKQVLYYRGCIFWRRQSMTLLQRKKVRAVAKFSCEGKETLLYRCTPAWFANKGIGVAVLPKKAIVMKGLIVITLPPAPTRDISLVRKIVGLEAVHGRLKCVIGPHEDLRKMRTLTFSNDSRRAHLLLVGLISPELLIV